MEGDASQERELLDLHVLMVTPTFLPLIGGMEIYVHKLSSKLAELGHEVTVLTTDAISRTPLRRSESPVYESYHVVRYPCYGFMYSYFPTSPALYRKLLSSVGADIISAHGFGHVTSDLAVWSGSVRGIPTVLTTHGVHQETGQDKWRKTLAWVAYRETLVRKTISDVQGIITLTPHELHYLSRFGEHVTGKAHVIPVGVDWNYYATPSVKEDDSSESICFIGRIDRGKGLEFIIQALCKLPSSANLVLIGPLTGYADYLKELSKTLEVSERVLFTGSVSEARKRNLLQRSRIFCLPSKYEGASMATLEAMAAGKPIVATKVGGLPYIVNDGCNGFLVEYGDVNALAEKLHLLISDIKLARDLGERSRSLARQFDWSKIARKICNVYENLAS